MIKVGTLLKVKTKTLLDVFGECVYEVVEMGLPAIDPARKGINDVVKCVMLGGSGPSASKGRVLFDSEEEIKQWINDGIVQILPPNKKNDIVNYYEAVEQRRRIGGSIET